MGIISFHQPWLLAMHRPCRERLGTGSRPLESLIIHPEKVDQNKALIAQHGTCGIMLPSLPTTHRLWRKERRDKERGCCSLCETKKKKKVLPRSYTALWKTILHSSVIICTHSRVCTSYGCVWQITEDRDQSHCENHAAPQPMVVHEDIKNI